MANMSDFMENAFIRGHFRGTKAAAWAGSTAYSLGDLVYASTGDGFIYECITAGTSGASEPTWVNAALGDQTTDNSVTWMALQPAGRCLKRPLYIALYTVAPSDAGGGTEVSGGSYAREALAPSDSNWSNTSGTDGHTDNAVAVTFTAATANWGTIVAVGIHDRLTGGNLLWYGTLTASKDIASGDTFKFNANDIDVTVA